MAVAGSASYEAAAAQPSWRRLASPTRAGRSYGGKGEMVGSAGAAGDRRVAVRS
jgi:hypothetical protein